MTNIITYTIVLLTTIFNVQTDYNEILKKGTNDLYKEGNQYIYKGKNPNNYLLFNNEIWRIISFDEDGTIKIIRNKSIGKLEFDNQTNNYKSSQINKYLNNNYLDTIKEKDIIEKNTWNIGIVDNFGDTLKEQQNEEKSETYEAHIGLLNITEFLKASSNDCNSLNKYLDNPEVCINNNYLNDIANNTLAWTLSRDSSDSNKIITFGPMYFGDSMNYYKLDVFPVLYLKKILKLTGKGTKNNPFKIIY